ncbi:GTPase Era [Mycoplasmopsis felifaucium]|uniref:GTPase Era n=1 Tax=Mycoplasmopsis felifaucium TaxID=35768 RepID=UPI000486DB02|nr:GTPase Era [Mycoplasmopsis felifaucium]
MKVCVASIIGRPNVGKSSLVNRIVNYDVAIVSNTPQTTRDQITGVYTDDNYQLIFVDTPGIHKPENLLGEALNKEAFDSINGIDCLLFLTPINEKILQGDKMILERIEKIPNKIAVISKIDLAKNPSEIAEKIKVLKEYRFEKIVSISVNNPKSIEDLKNEIEKFAIESDPLYDEDYVTDKTMRFIAKEIIREAAINLLYDELPHSIAVEVQDFIESDEHIEINAIIYVKKDSQKGMLIGKNASMIKQIGINARKKMQRQFGTSVSLNLKVKVASKWVNDRKTLKKFGFES